ncbi:MAG: Na(+)-translocating NADH-quinone reductase subunit A (EC [uncultured Thiotrichaceae bacterium]|uniref:Na(+)-translocating NADH-quinone reductase subunit A n=1 Tax=uncultured Thiotrichaceae bacterium TaxID=298394 RepID=A0A6S6TQ09_9GAMM|nr:MAG: Na(+)-translocating NADH-quinone reductase subunit A (EC [uncultured Thiotrichaceae bacterium]
MKITKGLDISITGEPDQTISDDIIESSPKISTVAVLGRDYHGLRPSMLVAVGDHVKMGQPLFTDKRNPGINYTSTGTGTIKQINRGAKRVLQSVVIELDDEEQYVERPTITPEELKALPAEDIRKVLQESGAWTAIRTRPFSKVPTVDSEPAAIFVTAIDTNPLAIEPTLVINREPEAYLHGLQLLAKLTDKVFVCHKEGQSLPESAASNVENKAFSGKHPAGLVGTHIHMLMPVNEQRAVWYLHYQDVIAIGKSFTTGRRYVDRYISLAGPQVKEPRIIHSRMGASTNEMVAGQLHTGDARVISGSILGGFRAAGSSAFMGRYTLQISVVPEGQPRQLLHWVNPFLKQFSFLNVFTNALSKNKQSFKLSSSQNGSPRAMVPLGAYEDVMPLDILPTQLLRALLVRDTETAKKLGCLELDEDDLALCTFVCHSKYEYGPALRACLEIIERDG